MGEAYTLLMQGNIFGSILKTFELTVGLPIFYGMLMFTLVLLTYMKTKKEL